MPTGSCLLCGQSGELQESHVIPAFIFRWKRESSGSGYLRSTFEPNKRVQDGPKRFWLCRNCEERFSRFESEFASKLFRPYLKTPGRVFRYSEWLLMFCTSVSWRVLHFLIQEGRVDGSGEYHLALIRQAESVWREFLLGQRSNPGQFQQHLLPLNEIAEMSSSSIAAPNMNRYLMRAIAIDIIEDSNSLLVYSKLGRFAIFGFVHEPALHRWKGTKVSGKYGVLRPGPYPLPGGLLEYFNDRARSMHRIHAQLSERQQQKVDKYFVKNADKYVESDAFRTLDADVRRFGSLAFSRRSRGGTSEE